MNQGQALYELNQDGQTYEQIAADASLTKGRVASKIYKHRKKNNIPAPERKGRPISDYAKMAWDNRKEGDVNISIIKARCGMKVSDMNTNYIYEDKPLPTLTAKGDCGSLLFSKPIRLSKNKFCKAGTFPADYKFLTNWGYLIGMSVPPLMMARIANEVYEQWLSKKVVQEELI